MIINFDNITIDRAIPGLNWTPSRCSTLADLLAALVAQGSAQDVHAASGRYDPVTEAIIITLSNNSTFAIPAALLLPVVADGVTITGNGTTANKLTGYKVEYDAATGALVITAPSGAVVNIPAQMALTEMATDTEGLVGAAGSTVTTQQVLDALAHRANTAPTTDAAAKAALVSGVLNIPNPLPVANFVRTSKIGLTASYSATASSGTQDGNALVYHWTAAARSGTTGTATLVTAAAATTDVTFSAPGQYDVMLTITDANGNRASRTETINVDLILDVQHHDSDHNDYLATLKAAIDWINANAATNAAAYLINVHGLTADTARIVPNGARVHFKGAGALPVGVDFPGGTFRWSGDSTASGQIVTTNADGITLAATTNLTLANFSIVITGDVVTGLRAANAGSTLTATNLHINAPTALNINGATKVTIYNALLIGSPYNGIAIQNSAVELHNLYVRSGPDYNASDFINCTGRVFGFNTKTGGSGNNGPIALRISTPTTGVLVITDWYAEAAEAPTAGRLHVAVSIRNNGTGLILTEGTAYAPLGTALMRNSAVGVTPDPYISQVTAIGGTHALLSSSSPNASLPAAWSAARIYNSVFTGPINGPVTFATVTPLNGNQQT